MISDYIAEMGLAAIKNKSMTVKQKQEIKGRIEEFIEQQNEINISCTIEEELDFEGLANYLQSDFLGDVRVLLFETAKDRKAAWETVMSKAETYAQAKTNLSCARAKKMTETAINILQRFYRFEMSCESKLFAAEVIDTISDETKQQLAKQTEEIADLIKRAIKEYVDTSAIVDRQAPQQDDAQQTCGCKDVETEIVFLIDERGEMVLDSPRYFALLDWISRGSNGNFRIIIEDKGVEANEQLLDKLRRRAALGDKLSESEENQYIYLQEEIRHCENKRELLQKACTLFLNDKTMQSFCDFRSKERIINFVARLHSFNYQDDFSQRNSPDFVTLDFIVDKPDATGCYYFTVPICTTALLNAGLGTNLDFQDACLLSIDALDKDTIEKIMIYYYLDLAREILHRDPSVEEDGAVLSLLSYRMGLH